MKTVNVHEAKTHFSSLLARVEKTSEAIVICRNGEPIADLVPHKRANRIRMIIFFIDERYTSEFADVFRFAG